MFRNMFLLTALLLMSGIALAQGSVTALTPTTMKAIGTVDPRYQSYNLEMVEVMGGKWWAPYGTPTGTAPVPGNVLGSSPLQYLPPIDLTNPRLRKLAAALSPAYLRVSDTWANTMYFQDSDAATPGPAPAGFGAVLTGPEWKGVLDFSKATNAKLVTSFSIGTGVRDANGIWTPVEAAKILAFTKEHGASIAAAEFFNEPNMAAIEGAPKGYDAAAYGRDFKVFRAFMHANDPQMKILGPGPVGEGRALGNLPTGIRTEDMLRAEGPGLDAFSYHFYGAVSQRCASMGAAFQTTPEAALTREWLFATDAESAFYGKLRDRYVPDKPLWLSETSEAACGGNPWSADFLDSFRYLNQLGTLAQAGVAVVMHNTLIGSDYGLIDQQTLTPRPNYWAAVLWHRLMGTTVLEPATPAVPNLYVYAQCLADHPGGVALLVINADTTAEQTLTLPERAKRFTLSAAEMQGTQVQLNGKTLALTRSGNLPTIGGVSAQEGLVMLAPGTISFFAIANANNPSCR